MIIIIIIIILIIILIIIIIILPNKQKLLSRSCCAHLFSGARLIHQSQAFDFSFFSKYTWKDMTNTIKHTGQQSFEFCALIYVLDLVQPKIKFHISQKL